MKKSIVIVVFACFCAAAFAQTTNEEIAYVQKTWGKDKKELVGIYMKLTEQESQGFWQVYDKYEADRQKISADRIRLIDDYLANASTLTDTKAEELVTKVLDNDEALTKLRKNYYKQFKKVISPVRIAQFYQAEDYLHNIIKAVVQESLPFIGEIKPKGM